MFDWIIIGIVSILSITLSCVFLRFEQIREYRNISAILPKNIMQVAFGIGVILSTLSVCLISIGLYSYTWLFATKRIVFIATLWPIALIDKRKHIIPNKILLYLCVVRVIIAVIELIDNLNIAKFELLSCLIAAGAVLIILCVMRLIVKDGIGFGDIKLFTIMGLYFAVRGTISTIFLCFVVSFVIALAMLFTKKKSRKDQIAFAPAILIGTLISVIVFGA